MKRARIQNHSLSATDGRDRFCMHNSARKNTADSTKGVGMQPLTSISPSLSHQVLVPTAGIRGFLDASDYGTWLKYIREAKTDDDFGGKSNVRHFLLAGQIYYETTRDIDAGEELLLGPKASERNTLPDWMIFLSEFSVSTR